MYNGNPEFPTIIDQGVIFTKEKDFTFDTGYQKDWVFDYKLKAENLVDSAFSVASSNTDQAFLNVNIFKNYQLYSTLGSTQLKLNQSLRSNEEVIYTSSNTFTFGLGGKMLIWQGFNFSVGIDGKYQYACPQFPTITKDGTLIDQTKMAYLSFYAWQIGASVAYHIDIFSPYIGAKYLNQRGHFQKLKSGIISYLDDDFYVSNRIPVGGFVGLTMSSGKDFSFTIESRFLDENSLTLFFDLRF